MGIVHRWLWMGLGMLQGTLRVATRGRLSIHLGDRLSWWRIARRSSLPFETEDETLQSRPLRSKRLREPQPLSRRTTRPSNRRPPHLGSPVPSATSSQPSQPFSPTPSRRSPENSSSTPSPASNGPQASTSTQTPPHPTSPQQNPTGSSTPPMNPSSLPNPASPEPKSPLSSTTPSPPPKKKPDTQPLRRRKITSTPPSSSPRTRWMSRRTSVGIRILVATARNALVIASGMILYGTTSQKGYWSSGPSPSRVRRGPSGLRDS